MLVRIASYFRVSCDYLLGTDERETIDVSGLSDEEIAHISLIVRDLLVKKMVN